MNNPNGIMQIMDQHRAAWERYGETQIDRSLNPNDQENKFNVQWDYDHYFSAGEDALRIIMMALLANRRPMPARILDFPSGSGRVTRHLRAMFPDATIGACDLYSSHVDFCAATFGAIPFLSRENLDKLDIGQWDVIFCGSLLTHLPLPQFVKAINFIVRSLTPEGIAIVTLEGRHAIYIQDHKWKLIADDLFKAVRAGYERGGFGYADYHRSFLAKIFAKQSSYGVTLVSPSRVMAMLQENTELRILGFAERDWDDHQDVVVFGKPGVNA